MFLVSGFCELKIQTNKETKMSELDKISDAGLCEQTTRLRVLAHKIDGIDSVPRAKVAVEAYERATREFGGHTLDRLEQEVERRAETGSQICRSLSDAYKKTLALA
jgi:hypothetical protein